MIDITKPVDDFHKKIPDMAHTVSQNKSSLINNYFISFENDLFPNQYRY